MAWSWKNLFGFGGDESKKGRGMQMYTPEKYGGARPYSGDQVGYGEGEMKSLASAYLPALKKRATGESGVGFDPAHRNLLRSEYEADYNDMYGDVMDETAAQASGQGLRGGVPMSIKAEKQKDLARARQAALANIDLADMEARREDINTAFYQQPEEISRGAGIQQNRAQFDLSAYQAEQPTLIDEPQSNLLPALIGAAGTLGGAYFGGVGGMGAGGAVGTNIGNTLANKSLAKSRISGYNNNDISSMFADFQAARRRA